MVLVYDGACRLCCALAQRWQATGGQEVELLPAQAAGIRERFPELSPQALAAAVHLIDTEGRAYSGAEAIFAAIAHGKAHHWPWRIYRRSPRFARIAQRAYRWVSAHRRLLSYLMGRPSHTPYDIDSVAAAIPLATIMTPDERRPAMEKLRASVREQDVHWWRGQFLETCGVASPAAPSTPGTGHAG
jgi:predicted DCC family thiol-disulfide oxidoreductase YuxK